MFSLYFCEDVGQCGRLLRRPGPGGGGQEAETAEQCCGGSYHHEGVKKEQRRSGGFLLQVDLALQKVVQEEKLEDVTLEDLVDSLSEHEPRSGNAPEAEIPNCDSSVDEQYRLLPHPQVCGLLLQAPPQ